ncbi:RNase HII [Halobacillus dabanensis]|uniref:Ribonuclease HII n=1 Tax=Halobacillus dabanensis TaxID=240302 RepID=A0A1I3Y3R1_HALDA|nr:ribonuclease HII [Halobacillus dabanensis]SFK26383.1 RNase HII [Halobacillus dabanensis]
MGQLTIAEVKKKLNDPSTLTKKELQEYRADKRKGVQQLIRRYEAEMQKKAERKQQYEEMMSFERDQFRNGKTYIAGIDEAGRGPLAGPVVAAAVILPQDYYLEGLDDSKKLSLNKRENYFEQIKRDADCGVGIVTNEEIDQLNIYRATRLAMKRAVDSLHNNPEHLLIDAMELDKVSCTQTSLVKGDQRSVSIAAASVIAKVTRDRMMANIHEKYPMYHFNRNQGYGTKAHLDALASYGVSPVHRLTFAPVKERV